MEPVLVYFADKWWPAFTIDAATAAGYGITDPLEPGHTFVFFSDSSVSQVLTNNIADWDMAATDKNLDDPEIQDALAWVAGTIAASSGVEAGHEDGADTDDDDGASRKKKEKKEKKSKKDKAGGGGENVESEADDAHALRKAEKRKRKEEKKAEKLKRKQARKEEKARRRAEAGEDGAPSGSDEDGAASASDGSSSDDDGGAASDQRPSAKSKAKAQKGSYDDDDDDDIYAALSSQPSRRVGGAHAPEAANGTDEASVALRGVADKSVKTFLMKARAAYQAERRAVDAANAAVAAAEAQLEAARANFDAGEFRMRRNALPPRQRLHLSELLVVQQLRDLATRRLELARYLDKEVERLAQLAASTDDAAHRELLNAEIANVTKSVAELRDLDAEKEVQKLQLRRVIPREGPERRPIRRFAVRDPLMDASDAPLLEEIPIGDLDLTGAAFGDPTPRYVGAASLTMPASLSLGGFAAGHDVRRDGLKKPEVMSRWLATRDVHPASGRDAHPIAAFGATARIFNHTLAKRERRANHMRAKLGIAAVEEAHRNNFVASPPHAEGPGLDRTQSRVGEIDLVDFAVEGIDSFHHEDSNIMSSAMSQLTPLDSIASSVAASGDDDDERADANKALASAPFGGFGSAEGDRLPSVSQLWAVEGADEDVAVVAGLTAATLGTQSDSLSGATTTSLRRAPTAASQLNGSSQGAADGTDAGNQWLAQVREIVVRAVTPYLRGDRGKQQVLNEETFKAATAEIVDRVMRQARTRNHRAAGDTNGSTTTVPLTLPRSVRPTAALPAGPIDAEAQKQIAASAMHFIERRFIKKQGSASAAYRARDGSAAYGSRPHHSQPHSPPNPNPRSAPPRVEAEETPYGDV